MSVIIALVVGLIVGFGAGFLVCRNNRAKIEAVEKAAEELKK
jgi:septation ring formation regulator EzrA